MDTLIPGNGAEQYYRSYGRYNSVSELSSALTDGMILRYYVLSGKMRDDDKSSYSIFCVLYEDGEVKDTEFAFDVTSDRSEADRLCRLLCRNTVTPVCLLEVLESVLCG